jgi:hypothetical protein
MPAYYILQILVCSDFRIICIPKKMTDELVKLYINSKMELLPAIVIEFYFIYQIKH